MVNTDKFVARLENILEYYGLSASAFADKIGVQRSSLSHLLSGRNKPSLDFVLKVIDVFPEVDLYWILNGKGNFPKSENSDFNPVSNPEEKNNIQNKDLFSEQNSIKNLSNVAVSEESKTNNIPITANDLSVITKSSIKKIVIFYENGTFEDFVQKK